MFIVELEQLVAHRQFLIGGADGLRTVDLFPRAVLGILFLVVYNLRRSASSTREEDPASRQVHHTMSLCGENARIIGDVERQEDEEIVPIGHLLVVSRIRFPEAVFDEEFGIVPLQDRVLARGLLGMRKFLLTFWISLLSLISMYWPTFRAYSCLY